MYEAKEWMQTKKEQKVGTNPESIIEEAFIEIGSRVLSKKATLLSNMEVLLTSKKTKSDLRHDMDYFIEKDMGKVSGICPKFTKLCNCKN